ncbi:hypothetical protein [Ammoniphilus resinae]|uniref:Uncharacterized protein n=1 Tax=Ammoniphilus resinae TaxID=861532 RepID=A0ABS4GNV8_9BACL|nr:hypothetical protein [Ammoniphilus resinae]MBP1931944.1 hypothetical protein [Ammoniphilus resinae]
MGLLFVFSLGPVFYRWLKGALDDGGSAAEEISKDDENRMIPNPMPQTASNPPIGGGAQGNFRVYSVTPIPSFTSEDWQFEIGGLVDESRQWS